MPSTSTARFPNVLRISFGNRRARSVRVRNMHSSSSSSSNAHMMGLSKLRTNHLLFSAKTETFFSAGKSAKAADDDEMKSLRMVDG